MTFKILLSMLTLLALAIVLWFSVPGPGSEEAERRTLAARQLDPWGKTTPRQHARDVLLRHWEKLDKHPHVLDTFCPQVVPQALEGIPIITRIPSTLCMRSYTPGDDANRQREQMDRFTGRRRELRGGVTCRGCQAFTTDCNAS